jgi:glycosyltransferase involved in cell wall biosynthesis
MQKPSSLSIICPCHNEEATIFDCIKAIPKLPWKTEILVVDDGSTDKTAAVAKKIKGRNIKVISYNPNKGKGYAFRKGFEVATGEVVVIQDADMDASTNLKEIVRPIFNGKADFVNGSRLVYPMEEGAMKQLHIPGNKIFAFLVSILIGTKLTDSLCGYKAFKRKTLVGKLKEDSWPDFELLINASRNKMRIVEVPIHYNRRKAGLSKMKTFSHGWNMLLMLVRAVL